MDKLLLHICCATCAAGVIERLKDIYSPTCYFYNPNIHPKEEYKRRLVDVRKYCKKLDIPLIEGEYDKDRWLEAVKGLESEPDLSARAQTKIRAKAEGGFIRRSFSEGGQRCLKCYTMRLEETARIAGVGSSSWQSSSSARDSTHPQKGRRGPLTLPRFNIFGTTLSISPHKKAETINSIGLKLAEKYDIEFFEADFKKQDGFKQAGEIAREEGFYRQSYCGCVFSRNT